MFKPLRNLCLSLALIAATCLPSTTSVVKHKPFDRPTFVNQYAKSVALMFRKNRFRCTATAFERTATGFLFVSASHCVDGVTDELFLGDDLSDDQGGKRYKAAVLAYGDQTVLADFAVLYVTAPPDAFTTVSLGVNPHQIGEKIFQISAPRGVGRAYAEGYIAMLAIPTSQPVNEVTNWKGNILLDMLGPTSGSSGSTVMCEDQMKVCAIYIGHGGIGQVAEPIDSFKAWWSGVKAGTISHEPAIHDTE